MATLRIPVPASRLNEETVNKVADVLRAFIAEAMAPRVAERKRQQAELPDNQSSMDDQVAESGYVDIDIASLTERGGIAHKLDRLGNNALPLEMLADFESAQVRIREKLSRDHAVTLDGSDLFCVATVEAPPNKIVAIADAVRAILVGAVDQERLSAAARPFKVFIGHGGDPQWKYLRRALRETHGFAVEAYESEERAGYHTLVVVEQMVKSSSVAVVVMTGEDLMTDGSLRSRENVVHEVGFCQGALGIDRTIVLLEENVSEPSNIAGLTQIRFKRGALIDVEDRIVEALRQRKNAHDYSAL
jgi:predicted nucleotide-binding protein